MSLFNLFSKPKVEKARGYAEASPPPAPLVRTTPSNPAAFNLYHPDPRGEDPMRANSSFSSYKEHVDRPASEATSPRPPSAPTRRRSGFAPPPLFQAYPQSTKIGTVQVSTVTAETVLQKNKYKHSGLAASDTTPRASTDDTMSIHIRQNTKTSLRQAAHPVSVVVEQSRKIIVLTSSGYLLQYAESGPANRLPERALQLNEDSAAFACDLIPGQHYVLQISQTVDQQGAVVANTGLLSKLGLRSTAAKRVAFNLLLVMPDAGQMDSWRIAIRQEIEVLGGQRIRSEKKAVLKHGQMMEGVGEQPWTPSGTTSFRHTDEKVLLSGDWGKQMMSPPPIREDDERSETGTIDGIEKEAEQLAEESKMSTDAVGADVDAQSVHSSVAASLDQSRLSSLRSNQRISHSTMATTISSSRTNSLTGSPPLEHRSMSNTESVSDLPQQRSQYRTLASYLGGRRRSAMPLASTREKAVPTPNRYRQSVTGKLNREPSVVEASATSPRRLAVAISEPNLRATVDLLKTRHDSRLPTPPQLHEGDERPQSIVADLPAPPTWAITSTSATGSASIIQAANAQQASMLRIVNRTTEVSKGRRLSNQPSFSMPLRINPSTPENRPPTREEQKKEFNRIEEGDGEPIVHTLTAKIEPTRQPASSSQKGENLVPSRSPSARLSLFPLASSSSALTSGPDALRSPSPSGSRTLYHPMSTQTISQTRSDYISAIKRTHTSTHNPCTNARSFTAPAPIRRLRPSRSNPAVRFPTGTPPAFANKPLYPKFSDLPPSTPNPSEEAADKHTDLPSSRALSPPLFTRPSSRSSSGRSRTQVRPRPSLPDLEFGVPVVGLGPPAAPPPSTPLPSPPGILGGSRSASPAPSTGGLPVRSLPPVTGLVGTSGLGISVG
ncbi:hypothetical protein LTR62_003151 [Meristemomyces frigidus]|uniref:Uncharacterized protein n=1 Tax=Meristemomyces frigidus TaxID=1508187 RepID=A0AAN7T8H5_9PEZI|nr:hypothetical protein LTR62_003151 [Meristemomyces frigidus]